MTKLTNAQIVEKLSKARAIAARIEVYHQRKIDRLCVEAGTGRDGCVIHNAWLAYQDGKPWEGINYPKLRELRRAWYDFSTSDILDRLYKRLCAEERAARSGREG